MQNLSQRAESSRRPWPARRIAVAALGVAAVAAAGLWLSRAPRAASPAGSLAAASRGAAPAGDRSVLERWGIDEVRVVRSGAGRLLDLRYRIVDPGKAVKVQGPRAVPHLIHERTGIRLGVPSTPKAGPLRNSGSPRAGRTYFALFANPGRLVQRGDQVTLVMDQLTVRNLEVN